MHRPEPLNVLAVVASMAVGGLETYLVNFLSVIDRQKFRVTIVCTDSNVNCFENELSACGIETVFCSNPYTQVGYVRRIGRIIRDLDIDVVCDFRGDFSAPTLFAAKLAGVRNRIAAYRSTRTGFRPDPLRNLYAAIIHRCTEKWATKIIGNSSAVLNAYFDGWQDSEKYAVVNNGVDLDKFSPNAEGPTVRDRLGISRDLTVIGHTGTFRYAKNHPVLLQSFAKLVEEHKNVHLLLVGEGDLRSRIEEQIRDLRIQQHVTLAGLTKDVPSMLAAMDIYFFPSIYEGQPNALIEAMAMGLPFVASNIGEIKETVSELFEDQLFEPNDISGLSHALLELCLDKNEAETIGMRARAYVEQHFSLKASAEVLCDFLCDPQSICF